MKKILIILFLIIVQSNLYSQIDSTNWIDMFADFKGVCSNQNTIVVYGSNSCVMRSTDLGESWNQIKVNNADNTILKILNFDSTFVGINDLNQIVYSKDDGKTWNWKQLDKAVIYKPNLFIYNKKYYLQDENNIFVLDTQLELEIIFELKKYNCTKTSIIHQDKLVIYSKNKEILFADLNKRNIEISKISSLDTCTSCKDTCQLFSDNQNLSLILNEENIFVFTNNKWINNFNFKFKNISQNNFFYYHRGEFYYLDFTDTVKYNLEIQHGYPTKFIYKKIDTNGKVSVLGKQKGDYYTRNLDFSQVHHLNDSTLIAVSNSKTIFISNDWGKSWELKCHLSKFAQSSAAKSLSYWFNNKIGFFTCRVGGQIFRTTDGGTIWLPNKLSQDSLLVQTAQIVNMKMTINGKLIAIAPTNFLNQRDFIISLDSGQTFLTKKYNFQEIDKTNLFFIKDRICVINNLNTERQKNNKFLSWVYQFDYDLNIINMGKVFINLDSTLLSFVYQKTIGSDTLIAIGQNRKGFNICPQSKKRRYLNSTWYKYKSYDGGFNWEIEKKLDISPYLSQVAAYQTFYKNKAFFKILGSAVDTTCDYNNPEIPGEYLTCVYDFDKDDVEVIVRDTLTINSKNYFGNNCNYINKDLCFISYDYVYFENGIINKENLKFTKFPNSNSFKAGAMFTNYADDYGTCLYMYDAKGDDFLHLVKITTDPAINKIQTEENPTYFYSFPPYPLPASDFVMTHIYWDPNFDMENADISVYDISGTKVAGRESIQIEKESVWSGYLRWDCSNVANGIYLINVKLKNAQVTIRVIVGK